MKKVFAVVLALVMALTLCSGIALADKPGSTDTDFNGNGSPSGPHYNLNIIGVPQDKTADMTGNNGHRIFINLEGKSKILLAQGADIFDFAVLDANGTGNSAATFQLPNPDPDQDGTTWYSVYCRLRGKPDKSIKFVTTAELDGEKYVGMELVRTREKGNGKNSFENVTKYLLYVQVEIDGVTKSVPIFSPNLAGFTWYWDVTNNGCKIVQLRFYELETDTGLDTWPLPE